MEVSEVAFCDRLRLGGYVTGMGALCDDFRDIARARATEVLGNQNRSARSQNHLKDSHAISSQMVVMFLTCIKY